MFVITFYSYKGGVGRTMALVNLAVAEAKLGKRVLVVDFDLEAPGLPSYQAFQDSGCDRGIVDYITAYSNARAAPNVSEFISECQVDGSPIWLMPAGRHTQRGYTDALNAIDWKDLYEHQEGYLMFEDLKRQWAGLGFDYVLIDSRTGHTDVGGICTRQLPDAVVIMFLPNQQNIAGLAPIVESIRAEKSRKKPIKLRFCASNVPDLDDEKDILLHALADARKQLRYRGDELTVVKHYSSLEVLTQAAFIHSRPNSRLAKEYQDLRKSLIALNFEDREGALVALNDMPERIERARGQQKSDARSDLRAEVVEIRSLHPADGEIAFTAAQILHQLGDQAGEIAALNVAIEQGHEVNRAMIGRAFGHSIMGQREAALADLRNVLVSTTASVFELAPALQLLYSVEGKWTTSLERVLERPDTEFATLRFLSPIVMSIREALPAMARRMEQSIASSALAPQDRRVALNFAVLANIGSGYFSEAKSLLLQCADVGTIDTKLEDAFNLAIADWGHKRAPSSELFAVMWELIGAASAKQLSAPNVHQCAAVAASVLGERDHAARALATAAELLSPGMRLFSCWRFLYVGSDEMEADLRTMAEVLARGERLEPPFLSDVRRLVH